MSEERREQFVLWLKKVRNCQKHMQNTIFLSDSLIFCEPFARIMSDSLTLLIQYLTSYESNLLTSLFCKEQREQIAHVAL